MRAQCVECKKTFTAVMQETPTADGGAKLWFFCTHCNYEYHVLTMTRQGVKLRAAIQRMRADGKGGSPEFDDLLRRYQRETKR